MRRRWFMRSSLIVLRICTVVSERRRRISSASMVFLKLLLRSGALLDDIVAACVGGSGELACCWVLLRVGVKLRCEEVAGEASSASEFCHYQDQRASIFEWTSIL